jgi:carboxylate-amine ligase
LIAVDVVYRRTDQSRLRDPNGRLTWLGEAMLAPLRAGTLACVNGFGTGVADDKLVHAYVEEMISFYLSEQPLLRSVPTFDPRHPEQRTAILERIDELVVKPRDGFGGTGVIICPHARAGDRRRARNLIATQARHVVAQEMIQLSTCPTVRAGALAARHVDLRALVHMTGDGPRVLPGGLTRVALKPGSLVVNSSQDGGGKDTWVLA